MNQEHFIISINLYNNNNLLFGTCTEKGTYTYTFVTLNAIYIQLTTNVCTLTTALCSQDIYLDFRYYIRHTEDISLHMVTFSIVND